jgi:AcrR family transcriptional regulator
MVQVVPAGRPDASEQYPPGGRSARKRQTIIDAAAALFLEHGYQGTSMDDIAALAAVSKQTVYKNFADKQQLFSARRRGTGGRVHRCTAAGPGR